MMNFISTTLIFLFSLGILVVLHEWGHYIVAKLCGVWVEKFSIGFGPKILGFSKNGTDYRIAPIPLGGYVKLYGQDPYEEADRDPIKTKEIENDPRSFASKSYWQRMAIVLAGPAINIALCLLILPLSFMAGKKELRIELEPPVVIGVEAGSVGEQLGLAVGDQILTFNGEKTPSWESLIFKTSSYPGKPAKITFKKGSEIIEKDFVVGSKNMRQTDYGFLGVEPHLFLLDQPVIGEVTKDSAAFAAGLSADDRLLAINGIEIHRWSQMVEVIQSEAEKSEGALSIEIQRAEEKISLTAKAIYDQTEKRWLLGILNKVSDDLYVVRKHSIGESFGLALDEFVELNQKLGEFLQGLFTGQISVKRLGGPIQIASEASHAAGRGLGDFLYLLAFLSLQLGILNLLPIPVLDGGHALFMSFEAIIRRSLPHKLRLASLYGGMAFILGLLITVTFNDLNRALGLSKIWQSVANWF